MIPFHHYIVMSLSSSQQPPVPSIPCVSLAPVDVGWARPSVELQTHALQDELQVYYQCGGGLNDS